MKTILKLSLLFALLSVAYKGNSQSQEDGNAKKITIRPEIGPSLASHNGKTEFEGNNRSPIFGFVVGVGFNTPLVNNISIDGGLHLAQKESKSKDGDFEET